MKNRLITSTILLSFVTILSFSGFAHNGIELNKLNTTNKVLIENDELKYTFISDHINYFEKASFNEKNQYLSLKTFKEVDMIQVLDHDGNLEFQLPISGNLIHISMDDFSKGEYKVNLMFENEKQFITSELIKK